MRNSIILIICGLLIFGCQQSTETYPEDLVGKKALLKDKKVELATIQKLIEKLDLEIKELDPNIVKKSKLVTAQQFPVKDFKRYVELQGTVKSDDFVNVSSEIAGRIIRTYKKEGQAILRGQLVARLDLESLKKQIAEIETSLELAKTIYDRQARLWEKNIGSEIQYLQAKNNKQRLEKNLETLQFQLSKEYVYAPISGVVDVEYTKQGELATPGIPIIKIMNTRRVKVEIDVPENYLPVVSLGDLVTVHFPALNEERKAKIDMIGRTIDPANRTFKVEVPVDNRNSVLKPNLLAQMLINDYTENDAIVLPLELVQQELGGKSFVYIVAQNGDNSIAKKVYVSTGESYNGEVIIKEGLNGTEQIIVSGARTLKENDFIELSNSIAS